MYYFAGYQQSETIINEGQENEMTVITTRGHVLTGIDEVNPLPDDTRTSAFQAHTGWMEAHCRSREWVAMIAEKD